VFQTCVSRKVFTRSSFKSLQAALLCAAARLPHCGGWRMLTVRPSSEPEVMPSQQAYALVQCIRYWIYLYMEHERQSQ
jgi:hypothetical protein